MKQLIFEMNTHNVCCSLQGEEVFVEKDIQNSANAGFSRLTPGLSGKTQNIVNSGVSVLEHVKCSETKTGNINNNHNTCNISIT